MMRSAAGAVSLVVATLVTLVAACGAWEPGVGPLRDPSAGDGAEAGAGASADAKAPAEASSTVDGGGSDGAGVDAGGRGRVIWTVRVGPGGDTRYAPSVLAIGVGDTVHWVWESPEHTLTSGSGGAPDGLFCAPDDLSCGSGPFANAGTTYDHTFASPGAFPYFCRHHWDSGMTGSITVR